MHSEIEVCLNIKSSYINLFGDSNLKSYKNLFSIRNERDLDEFWLYMSSFTDFQNGDLFSFISSLYFFFDYLKNSSKEPNIELQFMIEESENEFYWTTSSPRMVSALKGQNIFFSEFEFRTSENLLTFKLSKFKGQEEEPSHDKTIYTFMPKEDLLKLQEVSELLSVELLDISEAYEFNKNVVLRLIDHIGAFVKITSQYDEILPISDQLDDFVIFMNVHLEDIADFEIEEIELFEQLFSHMNQWLLLSFFNGIDDILEFSPVIADDIKIITNKAVSRQDI